MTPNDLLAEAENKILDAMNYLAMHLIKLRTLRGKGCRSSKSKGQNHKSVDKDLILNNDSF